MCVKPVAVLSSVLNNATSTFEVQCNGSLPVLPPEILEACFVNAAGRVLNMDGHTLHSHQREEYYTFCSVSVSPPFSG